MDCGVPLAQSASAVAQTTSPSPLTTACAPPRRSASAEDHIGASVARYFANLIPAQSVSRMNTDPDNVSGLDALGINGAKRFVDNNWIAKGCWRSGGKHIEPTGRDDRGTKRNMARIDKVNLHACRIEPMLAGHTSHAANHTKGDTRQTVLNCTLELMGYCGLTTA